jgi:processive 1,2-diacylglycerol beta-glucosyltransferase
VDVTEFFSPLHRKIHGDGYLQLVAHAPELWGLMFSKTDDPEVTRRLNRLQRLVPGRSRLRFARHVVEFGPDVVLCTHFFPLGPLGALRAKEMKRRQKVRRRPTPGTAALAPPGPLVVSVVTDFEAHALWMDACVDLYCVAAEETRARLVARGAAAGDVVATGIPIAGKFSAKADPKAARRALGLRDDQPVLLVLSGGFGTGPVAEILAELDKVQAALQTVVVTGHNEPLRQRLAVADWKHPTRVLGFASNMHELMAVADLIITKPGGLTTSEVLALGRPLLIVKPIPGQEAANSDFLLERGAAVKVGRTEDLPYRLERLLGSRKLAGMARAAKALGRPDAARQVCRLAVDRCARRQAKPLPVPP